MKKEYIVDLTEEEADELMDEHWVGELVRCKDCKYCSVCANGYNSYCNLCHNISYVDGFCSEAEPKEE